MYSQTSFETLLAFGNVAENIDLDYYGLEVNHLVPEEWNQLGILQKRPIDKFVRCRGCGAFIPISIRDSGDEIHGSVLFFNSSKLHGCSRTPPKMPFACIEAGKF